MSIIAKLKSFEYSLIQKKILKRLIEDNTCKCNGNNTPAAEPSKVFIFAKDYNDTNISIYNENIYRGEFTMEDSPSDGQYEIYCKEAYDGLYGLRDVYGNNLIVIVKCKYYNKVIEIPFKCDLYDGENSHDKYIYFVSNDSDKPKARFHVYQG